MQTPFLKTVGFIFGIFLLSVSVEAQCFEDYYGYWKTPDGKFIKLIEGDRKQKTPSETVIGNKQMSWQGQLFFMSKKEMHILIPTACSTPKKREGRLFRFGILRLRRQEMKIRPMSEEMKNLFGEEDVTLFNDFYINYDDFTLDSLRYMKYNSPYTIRIDRTGKVMMKRHDPYDWNWRKNLYYEGQISAAQFEELEKLVFKSRITSVSNCHCRRNPYSCLPLRVEFSHNDGLNHYNLSSVPRRAVWLLNYLNKIIYDTKWKRLRKKKYPEETKW